MVIVDVVLWYKKRALNSGIDENFPITSQEKQETDIKADLVKIENQCCLQFYIYIV